MSFTLPSQNFAFYTEVLDRCRALIELNYWDRIDNHILDQWLANFTNDTEKYFAIQILFHLKYRNEKAMVAMFKQIIQVYLPQKLQERDIYTISSIREWEKELREEKTAFKLPFRFSTINKEGRIGESGDALFRIMAQKNIVYKGIGRFIDNIDVDIKTVILVDDMAGSGMQFKKFYDLHVDSFDRFDNIIYCPLVAHEDAIELISEITSKIHIVPAEIINNEHSFYSIKDDINTEADFSGYYDQLVKDKSLKIKFPYGFNDQAILYALSISTPNNNHPMIYHNIKWAPLLIR